MEKEKFTLYLYYKEKEHCIRDDFNRETWDGYSEYQKEFTPISLHTTQPDKWYYEKLELKFDPSRLKKLWLVVVRYTSGGTFGCTHGCWTIPEVCKTDDEAYEIKERIERGDYCDKDDYSKPWIGYFESIDSIDVERMQIYRD